MPHRAGPWSKDNGKRKIVGAPLVGAQNDDEMFVMIKGQAQGLPLLHPNRGRSHLNVTYTPSEKRYTDDGIRYTACIIKKQRPGFSHPSLCFSEICFNLKPAACSLPLLHTITKSAPGPLFVKGIPLVLLRTGQRERANVPDAVDFTA